jgi:hypothetical protein
VKSAFPTVVKERMVDTLIKKDAPPYLSAIINSLLTERSTSIKMDDFISSPFELRCGLPQGSPLSPILYIIYKSSLLIDNPLDLNQDSISLGFIDDVTHLVANKDVGVASHRLELEGERSLQWGSTHNAIFDKKKAKYMVFTHRHIQPPPLRFGEFSLPPSHTNKYLGIIFDSKLLFSDHLQKVKKCGDQTVAQMIRISRCSLGIGLQQSRNLTISVLRSRILYGSMIWASKKNQNQVKNMIDKIENQANRMILGNF